MNIIDISFSGHPMTWNNRRSGSQTFKERIGRFMVSPPWLLYYSDVILSHLEDVGSYHRTLFSSKHKFCERQEILLL